MWKTEQKINAFVEKHHMISDGDVVVAGISGGADSVAMFYMLKALQEKIHFQFTAVHINHQIRGSEAEEDERFVEKLCQREGVSYRAFHMDVQTLAKEMGKSLEEAGRIARYEAFEQVCREMGEERSKIALAHHKDDLAETMIHHLVRGTGLTGLCSLKPVSGNRIRPMLCLERKEIEQYLQKKQKTWKTDSTNLDDDYTRNKIRHHILAYLREKINPQTVAHMAQTAEELNEVEEFLCIQVEKLSERVVKKQNESSILGEELKDEPQILQNRIIMEEMRRVCGQSRDILRVHIEDVKGLWKKQVGKKVNLPYNVTAFRVYEGIQIEKDIVKEKNEEEMQEIELNIPGDTEMGEYVVSCRILCTDFSEIVEKKYTKWFDYDKIKGNLLIRHRKSGDKISVHPSGGSKKLKDYLIDRKIPQKQRDDLWMVADGSDVLWIINDRISEKYKITQHTKKMLRIQIRGGNIHE